MSTKTGDIDETRVHLEQRIRSLTRAMDGVHAELELAVYRLHQHGVAVPEIAHTACADSATVDDIIASARLDPDIDSYPEGPRWVELWPHHGWSPNR